MNMDELYYYFSLKDNLFRHPQSGNVSKFELVKSAKCVTIGTTVYCDFVRLKFDNFNSSTIFDCMLGYESMADIDNLFRINGITIHFDTKFPFQPFFHKKDFNTFLRIVDNELYDKYAPRNGRMNFWGMPENKKISKSFKVVERKESMIDEQNKIECGHLKCHYFRNNDGFFEVADPLTGDVRGMGFGFSHELLNAGKIDAQHQIMVVFMTPNDGTEIGNIFEKWLGLKTADEVKRMFAKHGYNDLVFPDDDINPYFGCGDTHRFLYIIDQELWMRYGVGRQTFDIAADIKLKFK